jgi:hypothetical protein
VRGRSDPRRGDRYSFFLELARLEVYCLDSKRSIERDPNLEVDRSAYAREPRQEIDQIENERDTPLLHNISIFSWLKQLSKKAYIVEQSK